MMQSNVLVWFVFIGGSKEEKNRKEKKNEIKNCKKHNGNKKLCIIEVRGDAWKWRK